MRQTEEWLCGAFFAEIPVPLPEHDRALHRPVEIVVEPLADVTALLKLAEPLHIIGGVFPREKRAGAHLCADLVQMGFENERERQALGNVMR